MSEYIRDESDPQFEYCMNTADQYKASLHAKYPLCNECQAKVDELLCDNDASTKEYNKVSRQDLHRNLQNLDIGSMEACGAFYTYQH
ncbi:hypothetical protein EC973_005381 [Apophysomyces ossiformis]|uniref:Uncharacterized protein n=1 Tax=Apophysomyces ossiformis TaxID=679940 RepID=A0A8H7BKE8_9FUNG|nr:hypothetical protein EC973_005381 [Apophysomyces ossiformis]